MFNYLLLDQCAIIHHTALESFTQFAESTQYEGVVTECIGDNQRLQDQVVAFLSKVGNTYTSQSSTLPANLKNMYINIYLLRSLI